MIAEPQGGPSIDPNIQRALVTIREHLGMDVAYLSEIVDGRSVFRQVDAPGLEHLVKTGDERSLDDVYCNHILEGRLPELIPDTAAEPIAVGMPITDAVPIGSHMSIPIRLPHGETYGMFCCLSAAPNPSLNERDLSTMRMFADLAAERVAEHEAVRRDAAGKRRRIAEALESDGFDLVFQPIFDLVLDRPVGFESLSRFTAEPYRPPNVWFDEAEEVGMGAALECAAIDRALTRAEELGGDVYVSVNTSPATILTEGFADRLAGGRDPSRLMLELTEHARVDDYALLHRALAPLRARGMMLAVDDAGAGYASLSHILQLRPDAIKLDMGLVRDIDTDPARRSLAAAMIAFAREMGILVIAEGIETTAERDALRSLGIDKGQGYLLGKPMPIDAACELCAIDEPGLDLGAMAANAA